MKVKIGNKWYSPSEMPILVRFESDDKERIKNMSGKLYGEYPDFYFNSTKEIDEWCNDDDIVDTNYVVDNRTFESIYRLRFKNIPKIIEEFCNKNKNV